MPISSISQAAMPALTTLASPAKTAADPAAAASQAAPDKDASSSPADKSSATSAPNMYKLNPDGTIGPLHMPRPGHGPGVVHA